MNTLGRTMKEDLPSVGYGAESNTYTSSAGPCLCGNLCRSMYSVFVQYM